MFSYDTDLTLDSIMVGKVTTQRSNNHKDKKFYDVYMKNNRVGIDILGVVEHKIDNDELHLLHSLFGDKIERVKVYHDFQEYAKGNVTHCECCNAELNFFNRSLYTICKHCNENLNEQEYTHTRDLLNV